MKKITVADILEGTAMHVSSPHDVLQKVTLYRHSKDDGIPAITFSWVECDFLMLTDDEAEQLGVDAKEIWAAWSRKGTLDISYLTFMNFRRYGWCTSDCGPDADSGYGGVIYANGDDGGVRASSREQVVRETMLRAMHSLLKRVPKSLFHSKPARDAFEFLLEDALNNMSDHANTPLRMKPSDGDFDARMGITHEEID